MDSTILDNFCLAQDDGLGVRSYPQTAGVLELVSAGKALVLAYLSNGGVHALLP